MPRQVRVATKHGQFLLDLAMPSSSAAKEEELADVSLAARTTLNSATNEPLAQSNEVAIAELSPGAAAIIYGHLPPPNIEEYGRPKSARESNATSATGHGLHFASSNVAVTSKGAAHVLPEGSFSPGVSALVQVLPWDFRSSFPEPLEEAIVAGKLHEDDAEPENVKGLHEEHARHALVILSDLDSVLDARRMGVDPSTGRPPRTENQRQRLDVLFRDEPRQLEHAFNVLMDVYEEAFGDEAADAFRKAIRAWHAGIEVVSGHSPLPPPVS
jgi:hypothetical protein